MKHRVARGLRQNETAVEQRLWCELRAKRFYGFKFRRQQPIGSYVVDFVCLDTRLVIELDGAPHRTDERVSADRWRTAFLEANGYRVKRYWNSEITGDLPGVLRDIREVLGTMPKQSYRRMQKGST